MPAPPPLLTASEVAEMFRVAEGTVYRWARDGFIPSVTVAGTVRFHQADVDRILASTGGPA